LWAISALVFEISLCGVALLRLRGIPQPTGTRRKNFARSLDHYKKNEKGFRKREPFFHTPAVINSQFMAALAICKNGNNVVISGCFER